jgi:hypothetical protein
MIISPSFNEFVHIELTRKLAKADTFVGMMKRVKKKSNMLVVVQRYTDVYILV